MSDESKVCKDKVKCEVCRTINLARAKEHKPNMQMYDKCKMTPPCLPVSEMPVAPHCIRVLSKEEYIKCTCKQPVVTVHPWIGHGRFAYVLKAAVMAGAIAFTYKQGIWGDQQDVTECGKRWQEYIRSFTSRRPPKFDRCGKVVHVETSDTLIGPLYVFYKEIITTMFQGVVKFPTIIKCMYLDYLEKLKQKDIEDFKERRIKRLTMMIK